MIAVEYPPYSPQIRKQGSAEQIFDPVRRRWVALTPEEWVRQHFMQYLLQVKQYPASLLAVEKEIIMAGLKKRCDIVCCSPQGRPLLLVECKEMNVPLDEKVLRQVLAYNISLQVPYIVVTNGSYTAAFSNTAGTLQELEELPAAGALQL